MIVLAVTALGVECRTTAGPRAAAPPLLHPWGEPDAEAFGALVRRTEQARGLSFVRQPTLELAEPDDPRLLAPTQDDERPWTRGMDPEPAASLPRRAAAPDHVRARVVATPPASRRAVAEALARLLDGQHHPRLVEAAPVLRGDAGRALRALLAASAAATARGGLGPPLEEPPPDSLGGTLIDAGEPQPGARIDELLVLSAQSFLQGLDDRESAFRAPALSTEQILRPGRWRAGDRPVALLGAPPPMPCPPEVDEGLGLAGLVEAVARRGGSLPSAALEGWRGDRLVWARCAGGAPAWAYVVEHDREALAEAFAAEAPELLGQLFREPFQVRRLGPRVLAWHGVSAQAAASFARGLEAREIRSLDEALAVWGPRE